MVLACYSSKCSIYYRTINEYPLAGGSNSARLAACTSMRILAHSVAPPPIPTFETAD